MTKKYVITGGACVGKTTLLEELEKLGYETVPEAARQIIEREQGHHKLNPRWNPILPWTDLYKFQEEVERRQRCNENDIKNDVAFLDRSLVDGIAYARLGDIEELPNLRKYITKAKYTKVFFLEHLPFYHKDDQRYEDEKTSKDIHNEIYNVYTELGFDVVRVPAVSVKERVKLILDEIKKGTE